MVVVEEEKHQIEQGTTRKGLPMVRGYNNHGRRFAQDRFIRFREKLFCPIAKDYQKFGTRCQMSRMLISKHPSSKEIEKFLFRNQNSRESLRNGSNHRRFLRHQTAPSTMRNHLPSIHPFSQWLTNLRDPSNIDYSWKDYHTKSALRRFSSKNAAAPLLSFSSISETPLDSIVMEKPYTVILMEDDVSASFFSMDPSETIMPSWSKTFQSEIPRKYGMSFASISLQLKTAEKSTTSMSDALEALKASQLPMVADAILVARGPCSSLLAQYYLESFSLKGLVMIDPILLQQDNESENLLSLIVSSIYSDDSESLERFRSRRLLVEPNAVPMMVVRTISEKDGHHYPSWKSASLHVAERHGDPDGPYGSVPLLDVPLSDSSNSSSNYESFAASLLDEIDKWIEEDL